MIEDLGFEILDISIFRSLIVLIRQSARDAKPDCSQMERSSSLTRTVGRTGLSMLGRASLIV
jgi:hypothetical protein